MQYLKRYIFFLYYFSLMQRITIQQLNRLVISAGPSAWCTIRPGHRQGVQFAGPSARCTMSAGPAAGCTIRPEVYNSAGPSARCTIRPGHRQGVQFGRRCTIRLGNRQGVQFGRAISNWCTIRPGHRQGVFKFYSI